MYCTVVLVEKKKSHGSYSLQIPFTDASRDSHLRGEPMQRPTTSIVRSHKFGGTTEYCNSTCNTGDSEKFGLVGYIDCPKVRALICKRYHVPRKLRVRKSLNHLEWRIILNLRDTSYEKVATLGT